MTINSAPAIYDEKFGHGRLRCWWRVIGKEHTHNSRTGVEMPSKYDGKKVRIVVESNWRLKAAVLLFVEACHFFFTLYSEI